LSTAITGMSTFAIIAD